MHRKMISLLYQNGGQIRKQRSEVCVAYTATASASVLSTIPPAIQILSPFAANLTLAVKESEREP
jgi:hypothetical protein